jgi:hypothetical protein
VQRLPDFGDDLKDDRFHAFASKAAAAIAVDFLVYGVAISALRPNREPQRRATRERSTRPTATLPEQGHPNIDPRSRDFYINAANKLCDLVDVSRWTGWLAGVTDILPEVPLKFLGALSAAGTWLMTRVWPPGDTPMRDAFENLRRVATDFVETFGIHAEAVNEHVARIPQFYRIKEWNHERYHRLSMEWHFHIDLVADLALELTRAMNLVLDRAREIDPHFRLELGRLSMLGAPDFQFNKDSVLPLYDQKQHAEKFPYGGREAFATARNTRDFFFGVGKSSTDEAYINHHETRREKAFADDRS